MEEEEARGGKRRGLGARQPYTIAVIKKQESLKVLLYVQKLLDEGADAKWVGAVRESQGGNRRLGEG